MDNYDATEQAYKNGYAKGYEDGKAACGQAPRFFIKAQHSVDIDLMEKLMSGSAIIPVGDETIIPIMPGRWIPVTEMLPEGGFRFTGSEMVLVVDNEGEVGIGKYFDGEGWYCHHCEDDVTHWMPLPEPPKL